MCFRKVLDSWPQPLVIWCKQANADDVTVLGMERGIGAGVQIPSLSAMFTFTVMPFWKDMDPSLYPPSQTGISSIWQQPVSKKNYPEFETVKKATVNYYCSQEYFTNNKERESMEGHDRHVIKYLSLHYTWYLGNCFLCCIFTVNSWRSISRPAFISIVTFWENFSSNPHAHMGGFQR